MGIRIAEYLGCRTDSNTPISPKNISKSNKITVPCPFRQSYCSKAKEGNQPICSVRDKSGDLWITCEHRLCATNPKDSKLSEHQKHVLRMVATTVFGKIDDREIIFKREVPVPIKDKSKYKADYVLWRLNSSKSTPCNPERAMILEMQGGGETSNTGKITSHVKKWVAASGDNSMLMEEVKKTGTLQTNAWRRQQEQFLIKGNVALMTGARIVFCVGKIIYDYLFSRFSKDLFQDLRNANWTLAVIVFEEDLNENPLSSTPEAIPLKIDESKTLFTNYNTFVQVLTNQASPCLDIFTGEYHDMNGDKHKI